MSLKSKKQKFSVPELLAPAGDVESLNMALTYGADAIYFGGKNFSLRAGAENFSLEQIADAVATVKSKNKKAYLTANIFVRNKDIAPMHDYFVALASLDAKNRPDALILSDIAAIELAKKHAPNIAIHLSTQANTSNALSANFWARQGIERIVLSRELSLNEISEIRAELPNSVELEAFVHGAMCVAYAGRCLISAFKNNRSANRGECAQPCRFEYEIRDKTSNSNSYQTLTQDDKGSYILNSKDLNLIKHLESLADAGISSFKIEGRSKAAYYVANVVNTYRRAIDNIWNGSADGKNKLSNLLDINALDAELYKSSHREFFTGFYFNDDILKPENQDSQYLLSSKPIASYQFVALVVDNNEQYGECEQQHKGFYSVQLRNKIIKGDTLEILSNGEYHNKTFIVGDMINSKNEPIKIANKVKETIHIKSPYALNNGDMLRKKF